MPFSAQSASAPNENESGINFQPAAQLLKNHGQETRLRQLRLSRYRNYAALKQEFSAACVVFTGHNGAGKTNLLEAISLLSPGRGLRRASYADISAVLPADTAAAPAAEAAGHFAVSAKLESPVYGEAQIGTGLAALRSGGDWAAGKKENFSRRVQINSVQQPAEALAEYCRILWLIPAQDGIFIGSAGERRRFLDRLVLALDPTHGRRVIDYEKAMRSRNRLLAEASCDSGFLDAVEAQMAELGTAIAAARLETVRRLSAITAPLFGAGSFPQAALKMDGFLEERLENQAAVDVEDSFREELRQSRDKDRSIGRSGAGPHRSDLLIFHRAKNMPAALCSTGEQKALLTGLILAHSYLTAELSDMLPILLLDEVAAHLDKTRRAALFALLEELGVQTFMTGTDAMLFSALRGRAEFFTVENGALTQSS